jgi:ABC-type transport system involved in multi-copper enzyme maturation permease subunit
MDLWAAARLYARLSLLRLLRGRLLWVCAALVALPLVGTVGLMLAGNGRRDLYDNILEIYFWFLVPFVPAVLAAPAVAEEVEQRTFTFLFARPAPRAALVVGKYILVVGLAGAAIAASVALCWLAAMLRDPSEIAENLPHLMRTEAGALLGVAAFAALGCAASALFTRHPVLALAVYLIVVEAGLGSAPVVVNLVAVSWHLRNVADLPRPNSYFFAVQVAPWLSALVAAAVAALALVVAARLVQNAEYAAKD